MTDIGGDVIGSAAMSAWEEVCKSFADAAVAMLEGFAKAFAAFPSMNPLSTGIGSIYGISMGIAIVVAAILFLWQIARTVWTHEGAALAYGLVGLGKAVLAFVAMLSVTAAGITASNELTKWIIERAFGSAAGLEKKLTAIFTAQAVTQQASLLLILAVVGIVLVLVLWFELLLCNAAVAVLIGTSPIPAAGQISETTKAWWPKLASATIQLIVLKPVIALVFAIGFTVLGDAKPTDVGTLLSGMLILLLAALAWPAVARFFTFATVTVGGGSGLAALLGFAAGRANNSAPAGNPQDAAQFGGQAQARTLGAFAARSSGESGSKAGGAAAAAGGGAMGLLGRAAAGLDLAQRAANSLTGRMEQTAGFAGLDRHNPHPAVAGHPSYYAPRWQEGTTHGQDEDAGNGGDLDGPDRHGPGAGPDGHHDGQHGGHAGQGRVPTARQGSEGLIAPGPRVEQGPNELRAHAAQPGPVPVAPRVGQVAAAGAAGPLASPASPMPSGGPLASGASRAVAASSGSGGAAAGGAAASSGSGWPGSPPPMAATPGTAVRVGGGEGAPGYVRTPPPAGATPKAIPAYDTPPASVQAPQEQVLVGRPDPHPSAPPAGRAGMSVTVPGSAGSAGAGPAGSDSGEGVSDRVERMGDGN